MTTLLITILPSILIVAYFVKSDRFPEPSSEIIKIFLYGIVICFPAYYLNTTLGDIYASKGIGEGLISSFLTAAPVEEILKFSPFYRISEILKNTEPLSLQDIKEIFNEVKKHSSA